MSANVLLLAFCLTASCGLVFAQAVPTASKQPNTDRANAPARGEAAHSVDEPLPTGATARLGTTRFRPTRTAQGVSFLPDDRTLVMTTSDGRLEYWEAQSGRYLREVQATDRYVHKSAHTPDGRLVAMRGSYTDEVQRKSIQWAALFEAETGQQRMQLSFAERHGEHLALSADGTTIATERENLGIINTAAKAEVLIRPFKGERVWSLGLSADGKTLAIGAESKVYVWNWAAGSDPKVILLGDNARRRTSFLSLAFSPDGTKLAVGGYGEDGILLVDVERGQEIRRFNVDGVRFWYPRMLTFSREGKLLASPIERGAGGGGGAAVWNVATGKLHRRVLASYESVSHLAFSHDGRRLAGVSYWNTEMGVWDLETGKRFGGDAPGHAYPPSAIQFLADEDRLVSAGDDGTIRVWNLARPREDRVLKHEPDASGRTRWIRAMDVSPNGKYIASSSLDDTVRVWETDTGREVYRLPGHGELGGRRAVRFTPDSRRLVSWGDDMRVYVWDVRTGRAIDEYRAQPSGVTLPHETESADPFGGREGLFRLEGGELSSDASRLLVLGSDTRVFDVATGKEIAKYERTPGVNTGLAVSPDNQHTLALSWGRGREIRLADGRVSFSAEKDHLVELRTFADGKLVADAVLPEGGAGEATFSPDGRRAAITLGEAATRVLIVSVPALEELASIEGMRGRPRAVTFSPSGKRLAVANANTSIVVYDLEQLPRPQ